MTLLVIMEQLASTCLFFDDDEEGLADAKEALLEIAEQLRDENSKDWEDDILMIAVTRVKAGDDLFARDGEELCTVASLEEEEQKKKKKKD
jgi:Golgi nucleoside diphosphatase